MRRKTNFTVMALVCALILSCCFVPVLAQSEDSAHYTTWPTDIAGAVRYGIDVSKWQGDIDWTAVKNAGVEFAIIRCGYTAEEDLTRQVDPYWEINAQACAALGIPYGTYYYSRALTVADAVSEAQHALSLVQGHTLSYPIYYDLEDEMQEDLTNSELAAIAEAFCSTIEAAGYTAGVYANYYWFTTKLTDPVFDQWERWVAQWDTQCYYTGTYTMWQCSDSGIIDGITVNTVDLNIDFGAALSYSVTACTHDYAAVEQTDPTCTEEGSVLYTCSLCGSSYTGSIAATGHVEGEAVTESGTSDTVVSCTVCGEELSRVSVDVSASTSSEGTSVDVIEEPETENNSAIDNTVSVEPSDENIYVNAENNAIGEETISVAPSYGENEISAENADSAESADSDEFIYSTSCEHVAGDAVDENIVEATCTEDGRYESAVYCTLCGEELSRYTITVATTGHQFLWVVAETATETEAGSQYQQCAVCGEIGSTVVLPALNEEEEGSTASATTSSVVSPATGDATNVRVWMVSLLMTTTASVVIMMSYRRRIRREKRIAAIIERVKHGR